MISSFSLLAVLMAPVLTFGVSAVVVGVLNKTQMLKPASRA